MFLGKLRISIDQDDVLKTLEVLPEDFEIPDGIRYMNVHKMWKTTKGEDVFWGVGDTGCDVDHPDLKDVIADGQNFTEDYNGSKSNFSDESGHGTWVAGRIAARPTAGHILGVAPKCNLVIAKILRNDGSGTMKSLQEGLEWLLNWRGPKGEKLMGVNLSLGWEGTRFKGIEELINKLWKNNILPVCAAGNTGKKSILYPAYYEHTLSVGATDAKGKPANFSTSNVQVDVAAPGVRSYGLLPGGKYGLLSGTSMATPGASGFAILLNNKYKLRNGEYMLVEKLHSVMKLMTQDIYEPGVDIKTGAGILNFVPLGAMEDNKEKQPEPGAENKRRKISFWVGQNTLVVDNKTHTMDTAPILDSNGRSQIPARFFIEKALYDKKPKVDWDKETMQVTAEFDV